MASPMTLLADTIAAASGVTRIDTDMERVLISPLVSKIHGFIKESEGSRYAWEQQAMNNIRAYRGEDIKEFRSSEDPTKKVFVRTTTVKTRAAYGQIMEALTANARFPIMVESTPSPSGVAKYAHLPDGGTPTEQDAQGPDSQEDFGIGFEGDGKTLAPGSTFDNMSFLDEEGNPYQDSGLVEGPDRTGQGTMISPAKRASEEMNQIIHDQLAESNAPKELRKSVFEACLTGSGCMKGIFTEEKTLHIWDDDGEYSPKFVKYPRVSFVSIWDLYLDPNAMHADDAEWAIERHRYTSKQMRDLKAKTAFNDDAIDRCVSGGANYVNKGFESVVREASVIFNKGRLWEVLEFWGYISKKEAITAGLEVGDSVGDQVQVNIWVCGSEVLRIVTNPFLPQRLPYYVFSYEQNPYNQLGVGVPEMMEDSQSMMNGFARLAVENLALSGNLVIEVDESSLVPGQSMEIYPGKIFKRQTGQAGQAIHGLEFPNTSQANMLMFREWRQIADEATGIPSVSHGQTGVTGVGRTSSGLSTILEAASVNIKTVIGNIDQDLLQPMGKSLFYWNNQYNFDNLPKGDFDVVATGMKSFTKREVAIQRITTFLTLAAQPAIAPLVKMPTLLRDLAVQMDMDPNEVVNDIEDAKVYAAIIGAAGGITTQSKQAAQNQEASAGGQGEGGGNPEGIGNEAGANAQSAGVPALPSA